MILDYVSLAILIFVVLTLVYGIVAIHDIPYEIARRRDHPHQDAITAAGWVSLFTLHAKPVCMVAMEACAGAHYWAREIAKFGHSVRLIPPAYVKPFVK